jgi:hypothetical protein
MRAAGIGRKGSPLIGFVVILASFAAAGYLWFQYSAASQKQRVAYLENLSGRLRSETVPLKFLVLSRDGGWIRARVKMYDLSGREVAALEKSWAGSELYVDILLVPVRSGKDGDKADSWIAFPYRIFTDKIAAASGTILFDSYDEGGFPEVLEGLEWSAAERATIASAFAAARRSAAAGLPATTSAKGSFGSAVHEVSELSKFGPGIIYKVVCRAKGGVEIMED